MERDLLGRISINPKICGGRPCVKGHRIPVELVLDLLAGGVALQEIASENYYPTLTIEDVYACIAFANQFVRNDEIHFAEDLVADRR